MRFINPNFHVILVHYPLGVFVLGVFLELFGLLWKRSSIRTAARWMIVLGALLTIPAATSGMFAYAQLYQYAKVNDVNYAMLRMHVIYMGIASILATFCAVVGLGASDRWRKYLYLPLLLGVLGAWGLMVIGAWNAGETIFTQGTGVTISDSKTLAAVIKPMDKPDPSASVDTSGTKTPGAVVNFQKDIRPIVAAACYDCHSGMKAEKGGLRLDTAALFSQGGKKEGAKIVVKGNPQASEMYRRITLPQDDDDVMPEDKPSAHKHLTTEQTDLVKAWIEQGGDFGAWTADTDPAAARTAARDAEAAEAKRQAGKHIVEVMSGHDKPSNIHANFFDSMKSMIAVGQQTADKMQHPAKPETVATPPDMIAVMKSSTPAEMMDHAGGAIQQHLVLAGFAFAAAFFALGLSIRRLHSPSLVKEAPAVVAPPAPMAPGDARRTAHDQDMTRVFNPRTAVGPAAAVVHSIPSARFWLLTALIIIATASMGYWEAAGAANVLTPKGWTEFVHMMTPADPAVKLNRVGAHVVLGGSFLVLSLICAMLAAFAPKRPIMLGIFSILLIAVIAAQVWMGVLLTFDKDAHDVTFFRRAKDVQVAAPNPSAPADVTPPPTTAPSISAPTTTTTQTPDTTTPLVTVTVPPVTIPPATVTVPPITTRPVTITPPDITTPPLTVTTPAITTRPVTVTPPEITAPHVTVTTPPITTRPATVTPPEITAPHVTVTTPPITTRPVTVRIPDITTSPATVTIPDVTTRPAPVKKKLPATRAAHPTTVPSATPTTKPAKPQTAPTEDHPKAKPESE